MKRYDIEVIHEPSGAYLNYSFFTDEEESEMDILAEFTRDISIVVTDVEDVEEEE
jgi:hypothetical protein